jgi:hypothetical protein
MSILTVRQRDTLIPLTDVGTAPGLLVFAASLFDSVASGIRAHGMEIAPFLACKCVLRI